MVAGYATSDNKEHGRKDDERKKSTGSITDSHSPVCALTNILYRVISSLANEAGFVPARMEMWHVAFEIVGEYSVSHDVIVADEEHELSSNVSALDVRQALVLYRC